MKYIYISGPIIENGDKWIYDWFEEDAICPNDVIKELPEDGEPITVVINSGGGYVIPGNEIYTRLKLYNGEVTTLVIEAASAASIIAMAGDVVQITPPGQIMIHNASMQSGGDYRNMEKASDILKKRNRSIANAYRIKTGMDEETLLELMNQETWMTAEEAKERGFVDEILFEEPEEAKLIASVDGSGLLPSNVIKKFQAMRQENALEGLGEHQNSGKENKKPVNPMTRFLF